MEILWNWIKVVFVQLFKLVKTLNYTCNAHTYINYILIELTESHQKFYNVSPSEQPLNLDWPIDSSHIPQRLEINK